MMRGKRFRRHGLIRPTIGGLVLLAVGAGCCFGGLLLDDRTLMDATIAIAVVLLCALVMIVLQWFGSIAIGGSRHTPQFEQRDHHGHVVSRFAGDPPYDRRGRYVMVSEAVRWQAPLGLFSATKIVPSTDETLILPEVDSANSVNDMAGDARKAGLSQNEQSGGIRAYTPGDPLKLISWKHTARRGELMTRETGRDTRSTLVLVVNTDVSETQLDVQVATLLPIVRHANCSQRIIVTDGTHMHEGTGEAERFLAAVRPESNVVDITRLGLIEGPTKVLVCDILENASLMKGDVTAVQPLVTKFTPKKALSTEAILRTRGCLPLFISFFITLYALSGLIDPDGMWIAFAAAVFAVFSISAAIPSINMKRSLIRYAAFVSATVLAVGILSAIHLRTSLAAIWTSGSPFSNLVDSWRLYVSTCESGFETLNLQLPPLKVTGHADLFVIALVAATAIILRLFTIVEPVRRVIIPVIAVLPVSALAADYALAGHTAPLWAIALSIVAFPWLLWAAHPERTRTSRANLLSRASRAHTLKRINITWPVRIQNPRAAVLAATPAIAAMLAVIITLPLTAPAAALAYRVPLSIGEGGGMFTSNTVSPMIDLKRNITSGSDTTVLTYQAYKRTYLRLTTLDNFDGDSWGYDRELALDAGLYGSGIQLGRNSEDELTREQRRGMSPLSMYMYVLGYDGYIVATATSNTLEQFMMNANVRISTLKSRFLPVPGMASYIEGAGDDWLMYQDGTVYNRTAGTSADTEYMAYGSYIDPITNSNGFSELSTIVAAKDSLISDRSVAGEAEKKAWYQARSNLTDTGLGEIRDDMLIINATIGSDNSVTGPSGWHLGKISGAGGETQTSDGERISMPGGIIFDDTVVNQLGFGRDDYVIGVGTGNRLVLAFPASAQSQSNNQTMEGGIATFYGQDLWASQAIAVLEQNDFDLSGYTMMQGSDTDASSPFSDRLREYVERSDKRAHAERYTSLPSQLPTNVRAVINQAKAAGIPTKGASYDDQVRAMRWLVEYFTNPDNKFTYSLDAPDGDGRDNLEVINNFLASVDDGGHSGYCQHYASALAVLGRALGVPTRIVLGYNAGVEERNKDGFFAVQSKQLHAWTEAYLDGVGWVPFDVTPATEENGSASSDTASSSNTADSSNDANDLVTTISPDTSQSEESSNNSSAQNDSADKKSDNANNQQTADTTAAADGSSNWWNRVSAGFLAWPMWVRVLVAIAVALALAGIGAGTPHLWRWLRRRRVKHIVARAKAHPDDLALAARAWKAIWREIRVSAKLRPRPKPTDTDMDIAQRIATQYPAWADIARRAARNATAQAFGGTPEPLTAPLVREAGD